jgi:hypothetical protein
MQRVRTGRLLRRRFDVGAAMSRRKPVPDPQHDLPLRARDVLRGRVHVSVPVHDSRYKL